MSRPSGRATTPPERLCKVLGTTAPHTPGAKLAQNRFQMFSSSCSESTRKMLQIAPVAILDQGQKPVVVGLVEVEACEERKA